MNISGEMAKSEQPPRLAFRPAQTGVQLFSLAQLTAGGGWQIELAHDRDAHILIWITRGQGVALFDGGRRGVSTHNALFVPAGCLFALAMGRQSFGQAALVPVDAGLNLPALPWHLRIRDVVSQKELTGLFEAMAREQTDARPMHEDAMQAHAQLLAVWLHRHLEDLYTVPDSRALRLMRRYCARISARYHTGASLSDHAAALEVTATHLNRVCKSATGRTASALLAERIVHAARSLLVETDAAAGRISEHLGFSSPAYFSRFILQHCGLGPVAIRKQARAARPASSGHRSEING